MSNYLGVARQVAKAHGIDPNIFERQINAESGGNPNAGSGAGAIGVAQFMPATARSLGIDPHNPVQSLNAAAKLMKRYIAKYGVADALRAYNAGEGAIEKSKGYAETNAYVAKILNGQKISIPSGNVSASSHVRAPSGNTPSSTAVDDKLLSNLMSNKKNLLDGVAYVSDHASDKTSGVKTPTVPSAPVSKVDTTHGSFSKSHSPLLELFWQGANGINAKNGARVPQGFVSGHTDHVHVAAGPNTVVTIGKLAQQKFGLHVGENPHFGAVHPVHAQNSYHYKGEAIDVSGSPKQMAAFAHYVANLYGIK